MLGTYPTTPNLSLSSITVDNFLAKKLSGFKFASLTLCLKGKLIKQSKHNNTATYSKNHFTKYCISHQNIKLSPD